MGDSPRRILLLITDLEIGGTPTVVRELAIRLTRAGGANVQVACLGRRGPVANELRDAGINVTIFGASGPLALPRVAFKLIRLVRLERIDTIFSFLVHANAVAAIAKRRLKGVQLLQSIQTTQPEPRWHWRVQQWAALAAERVVVPSPSVANFAMQRARVPMTKIVVVPNAVDWPRPVPPRVPAVRRIVGFIGRLDPIKNVPDLIAAMQFLPSDCQLHIVGCGPERERLERRARELGDRATFLGPLRDASRPLAQFDVLVLPSSAEGFGLVLIEAMAAGVPVVATAVPGIWDVVGDGESGLLVPANDPPMLAAAIGRVLRDEKLRAHLVNGGREAVQAKYTWDAVLPRYQMLLGIYPGAVASRVNISPRCSKLTNWS